MQSKVLKTVFAHHVGASLKACVVTKKTGYPTNSEGGRDASARPLAVFASRKLLTQSLAATSQFQGQGGGIAQHEFCGAAGWDEVLHGMPARRHGISVREAADRRQAITSRPDADRRTERVPPEGRNPKIPHPITMRSGWVGSAHGFASTPYRRAKIRLAATFRTCVCFWTRRNANRQGNISPLPAFSMNSSC